MDYKAVAQKIKEADEDIFLIYAFNGTGKTQLSVAYKDICKDGDEHTGVYYNAYSEDLFQWDNDEENDNKDIKLNVVPSTINEYHTYLLQTIKDGETEEDIYPIQEKLQIYNPKYTFKINRYYIDEKEEIIDEEKGIKSFSFYSLEDEKQIYPIKISRGEERIFVWCFFLTLFDKIAADKQYIFIDDPVSSLDDYNIFVSAQAIFMLMKQCREDNKKLIISTHHMGLFSILQDWVRKAENKKYFSPAKTVEKQIDVIKEELDEGIVIKEIYRKETIEENKCAVKFLEIKDEKPVLVGKNSGHYQYHLLILKELKTAIDTGEVNTYHMVLLRQVLECISSFWGAGHFSYAIEKISDDANRKADMINALSHEKIHKQKLAKLNPVDNALLVEIVEGLRNKLFFKI